MYIELQETIKFDQVIHSLKQPIKVIFCVHFLGDGNSNSVRLNYVSLLGF